MLTHVNFLSRVMPKNVIWSLNSLSLPNKVSFCSVPLSSHQNKRSTVTKALFKTLVKVQWALRGGLGIHCLGSD